MFISKQLQSLNYKQISQINSHQKHNHKLFNTAAPLLVDAFYLNNINKIRHLCLTLRYEQLGVASGKYPRCISVGTLFRSSSLLGISRQAQHHPTCIIAVDVLGSRSSSSIFLRKVDPQAASVERLSICSKQGKFNFFELL